jgi:hypothetical protein
MDNTKFNVQFILSFNSNDISYVHVLTCIDLKKVTSSTGGENFDCAKNTYYGK